MDIGIFDTDQSLETNGVWRPCGTASIKVASLYSEAYKEEFKRLLIPHEAALALNVADEKVLEGLETQAIAAKILLDWKGFEEDDKEFVFSKEAALRTLIAMPRFRDFVKAEANKIENFRKAKTKIEVGNSAPASAGS